MSMWPEEATIERLNAANKNTIIEHLGIEITELGEDFLMASMPVDQRTHQTMGLLHGGASVVLAETVGSVASNVLVYPDRFGVGLEVNANHLRSVKSGLVFGKASPIHLGRSTHVWDVRITDEDNKPVCISRLTVAIIGDKK